jgi:hypothetical protein
MVVNRTQAQSSVERWSILAAVSAAIFNILSLVLMNYQLYVVDLYIRQESFAMNYPSRDPVTDPSPIFFQFFYLTPMVAVAIFRRHPAFSLPYASILFLILAGRLYYLVQFIGSAWMRFQNSIHHSFCGPF